jgi:hypothetical protein
VDGALRLDAIFCRYSDCRKVCMIPEQKESKNLYGAVREEVLKLSVLRLSSFCRELTGVEQRLRPQADDLYRSRDRSVGL